MRILLVSEFFPTGKDLRFSGGVEARTYFVAKYFVKKHQVSVICSRQPGTKKFEIINGINIHRVGPTINYYATGKTQDIFAVSQFILSAIKKGSTIGSDFVEGNNFLAHLIAKQIAQRAKIPVIFWYPDVFLGTWIKTSGIFAGIAGLLLEKINLLRSANYYIAISKVTQEKLLKAGVQKNKISVIPCGIDSLEFKSYVPKQKFPTIVCVSRLVSYKRVADLLWAFALIRKSIPKLKLIIVGRGPEENRLKGICKMLKISSGVSIVSNLSRIDLIKTIKSSHLLCLPSETEGFGIAIIESAAAGVPFVISDIEVFKEVTKNSQGGLIFKLGNIKDLSSKIEKLLTDKNFYAKKRKEALKLAQNYHWQDIGERTGKLYQTLIH